MRICVDIELTGSLKMSLSGLNKREGDESGCKMKNKIGKTQFLGRGVS